MIKPKVVGSCSHIHQYDLREYDGRAFFTTDIHGHFDLLHEKMKDWAFDTSKDLLFVGGDNTDRGPDSKYILDYINEPWFISIQGNHEVLFMDSYTSGWKGASARCLYINGGEWAFDLPVGQQKAIYESFKALPLAIELVLPEKTIGLIHAEVPYNDWDQFRNITKEELEWDGKATAQWARTRYQYKTPNDVKGIDEVLVGHSPTKSGDLEMLGNVMYLDFGSFFRDKISFIQLK